MADHHRVLVINGGGVRGLAPAMVLKKLTDYAGKPVHELFDCVVGTSIGGIIAIALAVKGDDGNPRYSTQDVIDILMNEAQDIFPPNSIGNMPVIGALHNLFLPKYSRENLDLILDNKFGNATFKDTIIPITTVSYSLDQDGPRVWSTYRAQLDDRHNFLLKDAAGATSAAPTFFPPKVTKTAFGEDYHDIDGGIFANAPTFIGVSHLLETNHDIGKKDLIVVSIGTGRFEDKPIESNPSTAPVIDPTIGFIAGTLSFSVGGLLACITSNMALKAVGMGIVALGASLLGDAVQYGQLSWMVNHGLVDRMMKGAELTDTIGSYSMYKSIWINPKLSHDFAPFDEGDPEHMKKFSDNVAMAIDSYKEGLWGNIVACLNGKDVHSEACEDARVRAFNAFKEEFQYHGVNTAMVEELMFANDA